MKFFNSFARGVKYIFDVSKLLLHQTTNYYTFSVKSVQFGRFRINGFIHVINNGGKIKIGQNFSANSGKNANPIGGDSVCRIIAFKKDSSIIIGNNVGISNSTIVCWQKIEIGNNVIIGGGCKIWDTNFHSTDFNLRTQKKETDYILTKPISIGDNVFIGGSSIILKGVIIGANSIIAAGSVVVKSIPANCIAGGNPCTVIKKI